MMAKPASAPERGRFLRAGPAVLGLRAKKPILLTSKSPWELKRKMTPAASAGFVASAACAGKQKRELKETMA